MPRSTMVAVLVSLEGNIGAGKSTLLRRIEALGLSDVVVMQEPVDAWCEPVLPPNGHNGTSMLDAYYADRRGAALAFQMFAMLTRVRQLADVSARVAAAGGRVAVVVTERCSGSDFELFGRPMHDAGLLSDAEWHTYRAWHDAMMGTADGGLAPPHLLRPSGVAYLRCDAETCATRIATRARPGEAGRVDAAYLGMLHDAHERYVYHHSVRMPMLQLDGGMAEADVDAAAASLVAWARGLAV